MLMRAVVLNVRFVMNSIVILYFLIILKLHAFDLKQATIEEDKLNIQPRVYRGEINTNYVPIPRRGIYGEIGALHNSPQEITGDNMLNWNPIGASGPNPGQVTRNALPSAAICLSDNGKCDTLYASKPPHSNSNDCPTGIDWLSLGLNFDNRNDNIFDPIHSFEIKSRGTIL